MLMSKCLGLLALGDLIFSVVTIYEQSQKEPGMESVLILLKQNPDPDTLRMQKPVTRN